MREIENSKSRAWGLDALQANFFCRRQRIVFGNGFPRNFWRVT